MCAKRKNIEHVKWCILLFIKKNNNEHYEQYFNQSSKQIVQRLAVILSMLVLRKVR
jgi:hypothetical protein